jgi:hypothetical protein
VLDAQELEGTRTTARAELVESMYAKDVEKKAIF